MPDIDKIMTSNDKSEDVEYFDSYGDINVHRTMLQDKSRTSCYQNFILSNATLFTDKVVMDVGAGTGVLSLFCAKVGAKKVYAVEASPSIRTRLMKVVEDNEMSEKIEVIAGRVEDLDLNSDFDGLKCVDIIISEWMGHYLIHESMLNSVLYARDNFLKESGESFLIPSHTRLLTAPCSLDKFWAQNVDFWHSKPYDLNLSAFGEDALKSVSSRPQLIHLNPNELLSEAMIVCEFNLKTMNVSDLDCIVSRHFTSVGSDGNGNDEIDSPAPLEMRGVAIWFDCFFSAKGTPSAVSDLLTANDEGNSVYTLSTSPFEPETHWKQTCVVWPKPSTLSVGEVIGYQLTFRRQSVHTYQIELVGLDPSTERHPIPCPCGMGVCTLIQLKSREFDERDKKNDDVPKAISQS